MPGERIALVGSQGRMGSVLLRQLQAQGCDMQGLDMPLLDADIARACHGARLVLLCVPAAALKSVIRRLSPYMEAGTVLVDITSVKLRPMEVMEAEWSGAVVGTHPLFGPAPAPDTELSVALVPGKRATEEDILLVEALFSCLGCTTFRCTAAQHDEAMAMMQGLNFLSDVAYFAATAGKPELLPFLTPSFRRRREAARKLMTDDAELFSGLVEANPLMRKVVARYRACLSLAVAGDSLLLAKRAAWWWNKEQVARAEHS